MEPLCRASPDVVVELRQALGAQARRVQTLVDQLLDLSRLDAEVVEITPEPIAIRALPGPDLVMEATLAGEVAPGTFATS